MGCGHLIAKRAVAIVCIGYLILASVYERVSAMYGRFQSSSSLQDSEDVESARDSSTSEPTAIARVVPKLPPVMSDALESPCGGLQGLAWYWAAFVCDDWGNVANELLEPTPEGLSPTQGRKISLQNLVYSCAYGAIDVRIEAPKAPEPYSNSTRKRSTKHKKRRK
jgi:hypothetical protein